MKAKLLIGLGLALAMPSVAGAETIQLHIQEAVPALDQRDGRPIVKITFTPASSTHAAMFSARNIGKQIHLRADGKLLSSPYVLNHMETRTIQISGGLTMESALALARLLMMGVNFTVDNEPVADVHQ
ncbi:SecDF P1 head subdomain-containing protein [Neorhizobium sp. DT-125]|uniref:SecDF P1 head subdomain-containing protein n=1 Tax=Neorhizobium sp. DT-125 TaxID=3396163 RepID=UPI003F1B3E62